MLKLVIAKEAHLLKEGTIEKTKVWSEIDSELWEQEFMKNYNDNRAKIIARTNPQWVRTIVDKFHSLLKFYSKKFGWDEFFSSINEEGLSFHTGDLAEMTKMVRRIMIEMTKTFGSAANKGSCKSSMASNLEKKRKLHGISNTVSSLESDMEYKLQVYVKDNGIGDCELVGKSIVGLGMQELIPELGIDGLLGIYCEPNAGFNAANIKLNRNIC